MHKLWRQIGLSNIFLKRWLFKSRLGTQKTYAYPTVSTVTETSIVANACSVAQLYKSTNRKAQKGKTTCAPEQGPTGITPHSVTLKGPHTGALILISYRIRTGWVFGITFPLSLCIAFRAASSVAKCTKQYPAGSPVYLFLITLTFWGCSPILWKADITKLSVI